MISAARPVTTLCVLAMAARDEDPPADDDRVSRRRLEASLQKWGHEVLLAGDGEEARAALEAAGAPELAIHDWEMPGMDGLEVCRRARARAGERPLYIILLTARSGRGDVVAGLAAGADDYVSKPFDDSELRARVQVGTRVVQLQRELTDRLAQLEQALSRVNELQGLLPICSYCKRVRDDGNYWHQVESYVSAHSAARFSHGVCPDCIERVVKPEMEERRRKRASAPPAKEE